MLHAHLSHDELARTVTGITLALLGIFQIRSPGCFSGIGMYFSGARAALSPEMRGRLTRVLAARTEAEGATDAYTRWAGAFTIAMGLLGLLFPIPYVLPYAASCLALATSMLFAYLRFRRATERRVAPLVRRTAWTALPPLAVAAAAVCLLGAAAFGTLPQFRLGAVATIVAGVALCAIAWRVAVAPAMLFGDDSQLEYIVDEHVRFCRATGLISLACAPPTVLVLLASAALPSTAPNFFGAVTPVVFVAAVTAMLLSVRPMRQRLRIA